MIICGTGLLQGTTASIVSGVVVSSVSATNNRGSVDRAFGEGPSVLCTNNVCGSNEKLIFVGVILLVIII
jgi:hypothetical protein